MTGTAFFTLSKLEATATTATVAFAYPIEGIAGTAVFKHTGLHEAWRLESASVVER